MLLLDAIPQEAPVVIVAQANSAQSRSDGLYGVVGACRPVFKTVSNTWNEVDPYFSMKGDFNPGTMAMFLFSHRGEFELFDSSDMFKTANQYDAIEIIRQPEHGVLEHLGNSDFTYKANQNYEGTDRAEFLVEFSGYRIKVIQYFHVTQENVKITNDEKEWDAAWKKNCPQESWEILPDNQKNESSGIDAPTSWYRATSLAALLSGAQDALTGFADLSGSAVAQTTGTGTNAQITLDTTAAGHTWYIDYTPYLNEEWLPTSSPFGRFLPLALGV